MSKSYAERLKNTPLEKQLQYYLENGLDVVPKKTMWLVARDEEFLRQVRLASYIQCCDQGDIDYDVLDQHFYLGLFTLDAETIGLSKRWLFYGDYSECPFSKDELIRELKKIEDFIHDTHADRKAGNDSEQLKTRFATS